MVKVGGNEIHIEYVKHVNFTKTGGKWLKVGGNDNFCETGEMQ